MMSSLRRVRQRSLFAFFLVLGLAACSGQSARQAQDATPVKSPNDSHSYRFIVLDNGLQALLISDPDTEKAAAALDVYVGSGNNPADRGGLAHFLEHMLFLGTDKYPDSGEYATFISEHGGSRNAYTGFEHTNYFFDVNHSELGPALDRFAQFFISPRFDAAYVEREKNAVQAEYQLSIKNDSRRNVDVYRELVSPDNPFSILGVGTLDTLADRPGDPVREDLLAFYRKYYSANLMSLVVLGRESLDELEVLARRDFTAVPNHNVEIPPITAPLYNPERLPLMVYIQPEASQRQLQLSFPMPDYRPRYREKPLQYIGNLLGHEGSGSLLSLLKAEGWAEGLGAGSGLAYRGGSAFNLSITLTESGMQNREQVLRKVFETIRLLQKAGPQRYLYEEQGQLSALQFQFRETVQPLGYVRTLANDMHYFAPRDVLRGNYLMDDFQPSVIEEILNNYLVADNVVITVVGKDVPVDRQSHYYSTPYSSHHLAAGEGSWRHIADEDIDTRLQLPAGNEFIAENVTLKPLPKDEPAHPVLTVERPNLKIWFRQADKFRIPKGGIYTSFRSPVGNRSADEAAAAGLYVALLVDSVNEFTYPALLAGLNFNLYKHGRGISLKVSGYDDKQLVLLKRIIAAIEHADLDTPRFANIRADMVRTLENVKSTRPFSQVIADTRELLMHGEWGDEALLAAMRKVDLAAVQKFAEQFWGSVQADVLINGNHNPAVANRVADILTPLMRDPDPKPLPDLQVVKLPPGKEYVYPVPVAHDDSVLFWYMQAPADTWHERAQAALTGKILSSDFFEQLRTDQQLGYVVSAFYWPLLEVPGLAFMVQSPTASSVAVADAVQQFLETSAGPEGVTAEQFSRHQQALINDVLQPHKNLAEESEFFWQEIARRRTGFDTPEQMADAIRAVDYEQWRMWFRGALLDDRADVIVTAQGRWQVHPEGESVSSPRQFKNDHDTYSVQ
jgi:insulysin